MNEIQTNYKVSSSIAPSISTAQTVQAPQTALPDTQTSPSLHISAEAQYLFEMNKYMADLEDAEREDVLTYLSQSTDPLQQKAAENFKQTQQQLMGQEILIEDDGIDRKKLLDTEFVLNEATRIVARPLSTDIFRLDGKENYIAIRQGNVNELKNQVELLEKESADIFAPQDAANLFGSVIHALNASETIFFSADDVIYFNYLYQKANDAIQFFDAPEEIKSTLKDFLKEGINFQKAMQKQVLDDSRAFFDHAQFGQIVRENFRLGSAAQHFNEQFQNKLQSANLSVLNSSGVINNLLMENLDLVQFQPAKINDALDFYRKDYERFERALHKDFSLPEVETKPIVDTQLLNTGRDYALRVIEEIQHYVTADT